MNESSPSSTCPPDSSLSGHTTDAQNNGNKKSLYIQQTHSKVILSLVVQNKQYTINNILFSCQPFYLYLKFSFKLVLTTNKKKDKKVSQKRNTLQKIPFISTQKSLLIVGQGQNGMQRKHLSFQTGAKQIQRFF